MKKGISWIIVLGFLETASGAWVTVTGIAESMVPPTVNVFNSDTQGIYIRVAIPGFEMGDTVVGGQTYQRITIPDFISDVGNNAGKPQVPYINLSIAVPDSADIDVEIHTTEDKTYDDIMLYPVPNIVVKSDSDSCFYCAEEFYLDSAFYEIDTVYPGYSYEYHSEDYWRGQRVVEIRLFPVQYNPDKNEMYVWKQVDVHLTYSGLVLMNEKGLGPFERIGSEALINYQEVDTTILPNPNRGVHYYTYLCNPNNIADYIIVTNEVFLADETDSLAIHAFAEWRVDHNDLDVGVVKMVDIYEEFLDAEYDSVKALKDFLCYAYTYWDAPTMPDGHFGYCLLVGDWDYVPTRLAIDQIEGQDWLAADEFHFTLLSSVEDSLPDIMLGRWPVNPSDPYEESEVVIISEKTMNFEKYPVLTTDFRRRGLLAAGEDDNEDYNFEEDIDSVAIQYTDINYDTVIARPSQLNPQEWNNFVHSYLNEGTILSIYWGHGSPHEWQFNYDTTRVKSLQNGSDLPVVVSYSCFTGMFQWDHPFYENHPYPCGNCLGEHFLFNPDGGAVAYWGGTTAVTGIPSYTIVDLNAKVLRFQHWIIGEFLPVFAKRTAAPAVISSNTFCLLGDPLLDLGDYTAYPDQPDIVIRPRGIDVELQHPYPYPTAGDVIPVQAMVWNIGGAPAYNIPVRFNIYKDAVLVFNTTVAIDEIMPRDSVPAIANWPTGLTLPDTIMNMGTFDIKVTADPNDVIEESWPYNNEAVISRPVFLYPPGWTRKCPCISSYHEQVPVLANLNLNASTEIVYAGIDSLYIFNSNGTYYQDWPKPFKGVYGVVAADIDVNGFNDVIAVSAESLKVYLNDRGTLNLSWWKIAPESYIFSGIPACGHVSIEAVPELDIVVCAYNPDLQDYVKVFAFDYVGSLIKEWQSSEQKWKHNYSGTPSIENVYNSGTDEVVISYRYPEKTEIFNPWSTTPLLVLDYGGYVVTPLLADVNDDDIPDVLSGYQSGRLYAYDAWSDENIWQSTAISGSIYSSPAIGDVSSYFMFPPEREICYGVLGSNAMRLLRHPGGQELEAQDWPLECNDAIYTSPALARLEGPFDTYCDILFGCDDYSLIGVNQLREDIYPYPLSLFGVPNSATIGDIDGDYKSETVLSSEDGYLHVWENTKSGVFPNNTLEWPQFHHDYQHTGEYGWISGLRGGSLDPEEFSTATTLSFTVEDTLPVTIQIYDVNGKKQKCLVDQILPPGEYHPVWWGKDETFTILPDGVYFIEFEVGGMRKVIPVTIKR